MNRLIPILLIFLPLFFIKAQPVRGGFWDRSLWEIKSVDTMKTSRDLAREKINDSSFNAHIERELELIKNLGANYVALGTPYDEEFYPYLKRWADKAHDKGLSVWFRGNWSGWEGWFDYPKMISREEHLNKSREFILRHKELFYDNDSFTPCPECEYGGPGSPLSNGDITGFRLFMLEQSAMMDEAFTKIGKKVNTNWFSLNPDVAKAVLNEQTVAAMNNLITLDYYVRDIQQLDEGLAYFKEKFPRARFFLGEFGAPIPDINGKMGEDQQNYFINGIYDFLAKRNDIAGVNYWVGFGGSTAIFSDRLDYKLTSLTIRNYYQPSFFLEMVYRLKRLNTVLRPKIS